MTFFASIGEKLIARQLKNVAIKVVITNYRRHSFLPPPLLASPLIYFSLPHPLHSSLWLLPHPIPLPQNTFPPPSICFQNSIANYFECISAAKWSHCCVAVRLYRSSIRSYATWHPAILVRARIYGQTKLDVAQVQKPWGCGTKTELMGMWGQILCFRNVVSLNNIPFESLILYTVGHIMNIHALK